MIDMLRIRNLDINYTDTIEKIHTLQLLQNRLHVPTFKIIFI